MGGNARWLALTAGHAPPLSYARPTTTSLNPMQAEVAQIVEAMDASPMAKSSGGAFGVFSLKDCCVCCALLCFKSAVLQNVGDASTLY